MTDFVSIPDPDMPRIEVNLPKKLLSSDEFNKRLPEALMDAAVEGRNFWESEAGRRLNTSRERYQKAIGMEQAADTISLVLKGDFATDVELGKPSFSLREGFLNSPKIRKGPVKMPRAVADTFPKTGQVKATRWMIVPLNVNRTVPFTSPSTFRVFTDTQPQSKWQHPGFPGVNISEEVEQELAEVIVPKHIDKLIDDVYGDQ